MTLPEKTTDNLDYCKMERRRKGVDRKRQPINSKTKDTFP